MFQKNSHCSYCGHPFSEKNSWPKTCKKCTQITYQNPIPVAVVLQPIDEKLLTIRRGIAPAKDQLALPGGFIELGETWQEAAKRELLEETDISIDPYSLKEFSVKSTPNGILLLFCLAPNLTQEALPPFKKNAEMTERVLLEEPTSMAFPLHTQIVEYYFKEKHHF